jgi:EVE domain
MKYWINVVSRNHVMRGVDGGFTQANHGKPHMLKKLGAGDWIVFYSPKTAFDGGKPLQAFTAIGLVKDDELYQV